LESNDQVLSINGSYFDDKSPHSLFNKLKRQVEKPASSDPLQQQPPRLLDNSLEVESLFLSAKRHHRSSCKSDTSGQQQPQQQPQQQQQQQQHHLFKLNLLISRNVDRQLIRKNLKRPNIVAGESSLLLKSHSPSTSSLLSISSINSAISVNTRCLYGKKNSSATSTQYPSNHPVQQQLLLYNVCNGQLETGVVSSEKEAVFSSTNSNRKLSESTGAARLTSNSSTLLNNNTNANYSNNATTASVQPSSTSAFTKYPQSCHVTTHKRGAGDTMVLNTQWTQVEFIELQNETAPRGGSHANASNPSTTAAVIKAVPPSAAPPATSFNTSVKSFMASSAGAATLPVGSSSGFGFGITGNKSTGVVIKAITPGGAACKVSLLLFYIVFTCRLL
jgi:hypothetical protein